MRVFITAAAVILAISAAYAGFNNGCGLSFCNKTAGVSGGGGGPTCNGTIDLSTGCAMPMLGGL